MGYWDVWDGSSFVYEAAMDVTENCIPSKLCVNGGGIWVSGTYEYHDWYHIDFNSIGAPIYYNQQNGQYLYPWFYEEYGNYWDIANVTGSSTWSAYTWTQNFDDIVRSANGYWYVWDGSSFNYEEGMVVTDCGSGHL